MNEISTNKYIYVVFSTTPYKIGSFIRQITRCEFNHVSIALDANLTEMYSFARYYKNTPFYGGFVKETKDRFVNRGRFANIQICRLPVTEEQYNCAKSYLDEINKNSELYRYNLISAICYPIRWRVNIPKAYTCVEFAIEFLNQIKYELGIINGKFCSTTKLESKFAGCQIFKGRIDELFKDYSFKEDGFLNFKGFSKRIKMTLVSNGRLIKSLVTRKA